MLRFPVLLPFLVFPFLSYAATVAYEGFDVDPAGDYADGQNLNGGSGGTGWSSAWTVAGEGSTDPDTKFFTEAGGLSYGTLVTTDGNMERAGSGFDRASRLFSATNVGTDTFYFSYIWLDGSGTHPADGFRITEVGGTERFGVDSNGSGQFLLWANMLGGGAGTIAGPTSGLDTTQPIFVVIELKIGTAADSVTAYFNPSDLTDLAGSAQQTLSATEAQANALLGGSFQNAIAGVRINTIADPDNKYDEIRVAYGGASMSDVVPLTVDPEALVYDGFDNTFYAADAVVNGLSGGANFAGPYVDSLGDGFLSRANGLIYGDIVTTEGGLQKSGANEFAKLSRQFREEGAFVGTIYASVLVQAAAQNSNDRYLMLDQRSDLLTERFRIINDGFGQLKVELIPINAGAVITAGTTTSLSLTTPTLIVASLSLSPGRSGDVFSVYFNPSDLNDVAGSAQETISISESDLDAGQYFQDNIAYVGITSVGDGITDTGSLNQYDELRVAYGSSATVDDVVPNAADPLVYEGFHVPADYAEATTVNGGLGGSNWSDTWTDRDGNDYEAEDGGLTYLNLDTTGGQVLKDGTAGGGQLSRSFREAQPYTGKIYFSALVDLAANDASDVLFFLDQDAVLQQRIRLRNNGSGDLLLEAKPIIAGGGSVHEVIDSTSGFDASGLTFLVGEIELGTSNDSVTLFINPSDLSDISGSAAYSLFGSEADITQTGTDSQTGIFATDLNRWGIVSSAGAHVYDELRIAHGAGASLSDVVPTFDQYNVLFLMIDDLRPQLASYGHPEMVTPELDTLASQSLQFNRAYVQQSLCSPSRYTLMTGLRPDRTGIYDIVTKMRDTIPWVTTLPQFLRNEGYHATSIGKVYHGLVEDNGLSWDPQDPDYGGDKVAINEYLLPANQALVSTGPKFRGPAYENPGNVDDTAYVDGRNARTAVRKFFDLKQRQPFFYAVGLTHPHLPFTAPGQYWDMYTSTVIDDAVAALAGETQAANTSDYSYRDADELRSYAGVPDSGTSIESDSALVRNLVHGYYASVSYADALVGQILDGLRAEGLDDNTVVVVWGDHGFHIGEQLSWAKATNFDLDLRIPLFIKVPGMTDLMSYYGGTGAQTDAIVETVDIYPTLMELLGFTAPEWTDGKSFLDVIQDPVLTKRTSALSQFPIETSSGAAMGYTIRTDDNYRYTEWRLEDSGFVVERELYDLNTDPEEDVSIHGSQPALVTSLAAELQARLDEYNPSLGGNAVTLLADTTALSQSAPVDSSQFYTLRFRASATTDRDITVEWENAAGTTTYFAKDFQLRTAATDYEITFDPENISGTDPSALLNFILGANSQEVTIDQIALLEQSSLVREVYAAGDDWTSDWPNVDADSDGLSRFIEYASNLSYTVPDNQALSPGSGSAGLPVAYLSASDENGRVSLEFIRRRGASDIDYIVEFSGDLTQLWTQADQSYEASVTPINDAYERVIYEDSETPATAEQRFGRMRIQYKP
jgi:arylsulfatase A-like enzyme